MRTSRLVVDTRDAHPIRLCPQRLPLTKWAVLEPRPLSWSERRMTLVPRFHQGCAGAGFSAPAPVEFWSKHTELVPDKAAALHRHHVGGNEVLVPCPDSQTVARTCSWMATKGPTRGSNPLLHPSASVPGGAPYGACGCGCPGPFPQRNRYVLVAMDYFTKWPEVCVVPD